MASRAAFTAGYFGIIAAKIALAFFLESDYTPITMRNPERIGASHCKSMVRCHSHSLIRVAILGVCAWVFLECDLFSQPSPDEKTRLAAAVNGEKISLEEVDAILKQRIQLQPPTTAQLRQLRIETLTGLIDELLIRQFLREHGPKIDPAEIEKSWRKLDDELKEKKKTISDYLRETNQTESQVRSGISLALQLDKYLQDRADKVDLKKYYQLNQDYFDKVTVRSSHIAIRVPADAPASERVKARKKLQSIHAEIVSKKLDFSAAAKQYSDCPSAANGGDIGYIFRKWQNVDEVYAAHSLRHENRGAE